MKKLRFIFLATVLYSISSMAQVSVNTDGTPPDNSAMLDVRSTNKGFLPPRVTQSQMLAIPSPANGLTVFCTTDSRMYVFASGENCWKQLSYGTGNVYLPATYSIGTGASCSNTIVNGIYMTGIALGTTNNIVITANVTIIGSYTISTNTVNGYSFTGSGDFTSTGTNNVTLYGSGTPVVVQTDQFTATASNSGGTCTFSVSPLAPLACGDPFTDARDNKTYNTIQIGTQCWMKENLNYGTMIDINSNQTDNNLVEKYCYDNQESNSDVYGGLYQWDEMMDYEASSSSNPSGVQGICPSGYHVPSDDEWCTLALYLDVTLECSCLGFCGTDAGYKMKTASWGGDNSSGFTGLAAGFRYAGGGNGFMGSDGLFWCSTETDANNAWRHSLMLSTSQFFRGNTDGKTSGLSVRCVKN